VDNARRTEGIADWLMCGLEAHVCKAILEALVAVSFLRRTSQDEYIRADTL
jgi:hypothetical protein